MDHLHLEQRVFPRWQYRLTTVVALIAAIGAGTCMWLFGANRSAQAELAGRARYIQTSVQLEGLYRELLKALADLAVRNQDPALTQLLSSQGITVSASPVSAGAAAATPTTPTAPTAPASAGGETKKAGKP